MFEVTPKNFLKRTKMRKIIGIPADGPELSDQVSLHFGHCNYFVGVEITEDNHIRKAFSQQNQGHSGCMEPVLAMKDKEVSDMIIGGIGGRPFMGFVQVGINLYRAIEETIQQNVELFLEGKLEGLGGPSCQGH